MGAVTNDQGKKSLPSDSEEVEKQIMVELSQKQSGESLRHRQLDNNNNKNILNKSKDQDQYDIKDKNPKKMFDTKFRKIVLLIIAVTVHNIPGK